MRAAPTSSARAGPWWWCRLPTTPKRRGCSPSSSRPGQSSRRSCRARATSTRKRARHPLRRVRALDAARLQLRSARAARMPVSVAVLPELIEPVLPAFIEPEFVPEPIEPEVVPELVVPVPEPIAPDDPLPEVVEVGLLVEPEFVVPLLLATPGPELADEVPPVVPPVLPVPPDWA